MLPDDYRSAERPVRLPTAAVIDAKPMMIEALVDGAVTTATETITIEESPVVLQPDGAEFTDDDPAPTEVQNVWRFPADNGATIIAWRAGDDWYGLPCPKTTEC